MGHKHSVAAPSAKQLSGPHADVLAFAWREYQQALQAEGQQAAASPYESEVEEWAARYRLVSSCIAHPGKPFVSGAKPHPKSSFVVRCKGHRLFYACVPHGGFAREGMIDHCYMLWLVKEGAGGAGGASAGEDSPAAEAAESTPATIAQLPSTSADGSASSAAASAAFDTQAILSADHPRVWHRAHMFRTVMLSNQPSGAPASSAEPCRAECLMTGARSDYLLSHEGDMMEAKWAACNGNLEQFFAD